jgi:hypothetical protein
MEALRAAAVADAAEEPLSEARARERAASLQTGVCKGRIDRRVWSASATSRATRLAEAIVVATDAQPLSRLLHHLDNASCRSAPVAAGHTIGAHERLHESGRTERLSVRGCACGS